MGEKKFSINLEFGDDERQVEVGEDTTVVQLKDMVASEFGIPKANSQLTAGGRQLGDTDTIKSARISPFETVVVIAKVCPFSFSFPYSFLSFSDPSYPFFHFFFCYRPLVAPSDCL